MIALLIFVCLVGHQDQCRMVPLAAGFVSVEACSTAAPLAQAWLEVHKAELEIRAGTRPICTSDANYLINRFKA